MLDTILSYRLTCKLKLLGFFFPTMHSSQITFLSVVEGSLMQIKKMCVSIE